MWYFYKIQMEFLSDVEFLFPSCLKNTLGFFVLPSILIYSTFTFQGNNWLKYNTKNNCKMCIWIPFHAWLYEEEHHLMASGEDYTVGYFNGKI